MKSCYVNIDRFTGVVEMEAPDDIAVGDKVLSELDKGTCLGTVLTEPIDSSREGLKKITRKATEEELASFAALREKEGYAFDFCKEKIREMGLPMKLLNTEYIFGGGKLLFYFISESRVDFRDLVKELAREFKVRVELRQVGVRDEAKIVGGLGNCGNTVCCRRFLHNFSIVSIKMVKEQNLALNPAKISGICGRLMCCLSYEYPTYVECKKGFPKVGKRVKVTQGEGKIVKLNPLASSLTVHLDDGKEVTVPFTEITLITDAEGKPQGNPPNQPPRDARDKGQKGGGDNRPQKKENKPPQKGNGNQPPREGGGQKPNPDNQRRNNNSNNNKEQPS